MWSSSSVKMPIASFVVDSEMFRLYLFFIFELLIVLNISQISYSIFAYLTFRNRFHLDHCPYWKIFPNKMETVLSKTFHSLSSFFPFPSVLFCMHLLMLVHLKEHDWVYLLVTKETRTIFNLMKFHRRQWSRIKLTQKLNWYPGSHLWPTLKNKNYQQKSHWKHFIQFIA